MELILTLFFTGVIIVAATLRRYHRTADYIRLQKRMDVFLDTSDLDLSGETEYTDCVSHTWVNENVIRTPHGNLGRYLQEFLMDKTLFAMMGIGIVLSLSVLIVVVFFMASLIAFGPSAIVFLVGALVIMGPGEAKMSELLLAKVSEQEFSQLNQEDYVYVSLAVRSVRRWLRISGLIGISFIVISPIGEDLPATLAWLFVTISNTLIFDPALVANDLWFPLAFFYVISISVFLIYIIPKVIIAALRRIRIRNKNQSGTQDDKHLNVVPKNSKESR
jgi:hypothetical protein